MGMSEDKTTKVAAPGLIPDLRKVPIDSPQEGVYYAYANIVNFNWTLTDVQLRFAELIQVPNEDSPTWENQSIVILERVSVTIPWYQAKILRGMLDGILRTYEEVNGEIKTPVLAQPPKDESK
jgi:hypothetical protein